MRCMSTALLVLMVGQGVFADPPEKPKVRLSMVPALRPPVPDSPITLTPELVLVCDADEEQVVLMSPLGRVKVTAEKGPIRVRGRFAGGDGSVETRTFAGPWVYFFEAAQKGDCEALILPVGGREPDVMRLRITCVVGPQPPPDPKLPDGELGLIKASREGLAKVADKSQALALAKAQRSLSSAIAAGAVTEPAKILAEWRTGNNGAVDATTWKPWADVVSPALAKLHADGRLPDARAWAMAFAEIAQGLGG